MSSSPPTTTNTATTPSVSSSQRRKRRVFGDKSIASDVTTAPHLEPMDIFFDHNQRHGDDNGDDEGGGSSRSNDGGTTDNRQQPVDREGAMNAMTRDGEEEGHTIDGERLRTTTTTRTRTVERISSPPSVPGKRGGSFRSQQQQQQQQQAMNSHGVTARNLFEFRISSPVNSIPNQKEDQDEDGNADSSAAAAAAAQQRTIDSISEIRCPVCLDPFDEPVTLGCNHNLCRKHILDLAAHEMTMKAQQQPHDHPHPHHHFGGEGPRRIGEHDAFDITCPKCRQKWTFQGTSSIRINHEMSAIVGIMMNILSSKAAATTTATTTPQQQHKQKQKGGGTSGDRTGQTTANQNNNASTSSSSSSKIPPLGSGVKLPPPREQRGVVDSNASVVATAGSSSATSGATRQHHHGNESEEGEEANHSRDKKPKRERRVIVRVPSPEQQTHSDELYTDRNADRGAHPHHQEAEMLQLRSLETKLRHQREALQREREHRRRALEEDFKRQRIRAIEQKLSLNPIAQGTNADPSNTSGNEEEHEESVHPQQQQQHHLAHHPAPANEIHQHVDQYDVDNAEHDDVDDDDDDDEYKEEREWRRKEAEFAEAKRQREEAKERERAEREAKVRSEIRNWLETSPSAHPTSSAPDDALSSSELALHQQRFQSYLDEKYKEEKEEKRRLQLLQQQPHTPRGTASRRSHQIGSLSPDGDLPGSSTLRRLRSAGASRFRGEEDVEVERALLQAERTVQRSLDEDLSRARKAEIAEQRAREMIAKYKPQKNPPKPSYVPKLNRVQPIVQSGVPQILGHSPKK